MHQLFRITVTDTSGKPLGVAIDEISDVESSQDGSIIHKRNGIKIKTQTSQTAVESAIATLRDAFITALGT